MISRLPSSLEPRRGTSLGGWRMICPTWRGCLRLGSTALMSWSSKTWRWVPLSGASTPPHNFTQPTIAPRMTPTIIHCHRLRRSTYIRYCSWAVTLGRRLRSPYRPNGWYRSQGDRLRFFHDIGGEPTEQVPWAFLLRFPQGECPSRG